MLLKTFGSVLESRPMQDVHQHMLGVLMPLVFEVCCALYDQSREVFRGHVLILVKERTMQAHQCGGMRMKAQR